MKLLVIGVVVCAVVLTGCASILPSSEQLQALSESDRSWCFVGTGSGVGIRMSGTGIKNGRVKCSGDSMEVESAPAPVAPAPAAPAPAAPARAPMFK